MIKHNGKRCDIKGCNGLAFARPKSDPERTLMCKWHYNSFNAMMDADKPKKAKIIKSAFGFNNQVEMFNDIWQLNSVNGTRYSQISNKPINIAQHSKLWYSCFAHVLPKGLYPKFRLYPKNIMLVLPIEHTLIDFGTEEQRKEYEVQNNCSFSIFYKLKELLKIEYRNLTSQILADG